MDMRQVGQLPSACVKAQALVLAIQCLCWTCLWNSTDVEIAEHSQGRSRQIDIHRILSTDENVLTASLERSWHLC